MTEEESARRWKVLRDRFVRELKQTKPKSGDAGPPLSSSWPLFKVLNFLTDTVKHKKSSDAHTVIIYTFLTALLVTSPLLL